MEWVWSDTLLHPFYLSTLFIENVEMTPFLPLHPLHISCEIRIAPFLWKVWYRLSWSHFCISSDKDGLFTSWKCEGNLCNRPVFVSVMHGRSPSCCHFIFPTSILWRHVICDVFAWHAVRQFIRQFIRQRSKTTIDSWICRCLLSSEWDHWFARELAEEWLRLYAFYFQCTLFTKTRIIRKGQKTYPLNFFPIFKSHAF